MDILLGTLGYMLVTFPYALIWHMKLFEKKYTKWVYFGKDPKPSIGLLSMIFQGAVLSYGYQFININHSSIQAGITYALVMGIFFWSCHVVTAMAKYSELRNKGFFILETIYLTGQFTLFGITISLIHKFLA